MLRDLARLPSILVGSVLGIGYLPVWHRHWAGFAGVVVAVVLMMYDSNVAGYTTYEVLYHTSNRALITFGCDALIAAMYAALMVVIFGTLLVHWHDESSEHMVIDVVCAQLIVLALGGPAVLAVSADIRALMGDVCDAYFICPDWLYNVVVTSVLFAVPFFTTRFFDAMEFWPAANLRIRYGHNVLAVLFASISCGIYALLAMYAVAFIFCDLTAASFVNFMYALYYGLQAHLMSVWIMLVALLGEDGTLYTFFSKIGLIDWFSKVFGGEGDDA